MIRGRCPVVQDSRYYGRSLEVSRHLGETIRRVTEDRPEALLLPDPATQRIGDTGQGCRRMSLLGLERRAGSAEDERRTSTRQRHPHHVSGPLRTAIDQLIGQVVCGLDSSAKGVARQGRHGPCARLGDGATLFIDNTSPVGTDRSPGMGAQRLIELTDVSATRDHRCYFQRFNHVEDCREPM